MDDGVSRLTEVDGNLVVDVGEVKDVVEVGMADEDAIELGRRPRHSRALEDLLVVEPGNAGH